MVEWWKVRCRLIQDRNIPFAFPGGQELLADIIRPATDETLPAVLAIVGGGWFECDKKIMEVMSRLLIVPQISWSLLRGFLSK